MSIKVKEIE